MKKTIAVQNPQFLLADQGRNFNGYNLAFFKKYVSVIYLSKPWHIFRYRKRLKTLGVEPDRYQFVYTLRSLNHHADVLLGFDGEPYHAHSAPPKGFQGIKIWHVMDYTSHTSRAAKTLEDANVNYLMGYTRHDLFCDFFKKHYAAFEGKVIDVPFGYREQFQKIIPFDQRDKRCVAIGAVNPVNDPLCKPGELHDYIHFYPTIQWTHQIRRGIVEQEQAFKSHVKSLLPNYPETKDGKLDHVQELNRYQLFVNDEGLLNFPPARTYEGMACGSVMVASDSPIYRHLGLIPDHHYIAFKQNDLHDFYQKIVAISGQPDRLKKIAAHAAEWIPQFSHAAIADRLYQQLQNLTP